eukprot:TRINITY_DN35380_c0_g1_i1.p3 TRINITY_DN35380_c0_g1~~TRINITY_DN35380_c0_g1_i1.p3  ORF type:complete len:105 (-),score=34.77 TRINITY_DN35380_c0_g1_i1:234-548(-)
MIRRPPISTLSSSSAASDVYKRQTKEVINVLLMAIVGENVVKGSGANSPCHVVRMTHKVSQAAANGVRFEVWMDKEEAEGQYVQMQLYFQNLLKGKAIELKPLV